MLPALQSVLKRALRVALAVFQRQPRAAAGPEAWPSSPSRPPRHWLERVAGARLVRYQSPEDLDRRPHAASRPPRLPEPVGKSSRPARAADHSAARTDPDVERAGETRGHARRARPTPPEPGQPRPETPGRSAEPPVYSTERPAPARTAPQPRFDEGHRASGRDRSPHWPEGERTVPDGAVDENRWPELPQALDEASLDLLAVLESIERRERLDREQSEDPWSAWPS